MATKILRTSLNYIALLDAIDAMFVNDLQLDGHVGIGRPVSSDVRLHVSETVTDGRSGHTLQVDKYVTGGSGGVHNAIKGQTIATPGWDSNGGQLFGVTSESEIACPGTGEAWGGQDHARVLIGADPGNEACGREIDVVTEVPCNTRTGMIIGAMPYWKRPTHQGHRASGLDSIFTFVNKLYGAKWKAGITFFQADPTKTLKTLFPIAEDGTLITATPAEHSTVKEGFDLSHPLLHFSGHSFKAHGFKVRGDGLVEITNKVALIDPNGKTYSMRSSSGAWSVRDEDAGTDRLRVEPDGTICVWTPNGIVTDPVTGERTLRVEINGMPEKLCLAP